MEDTTNNKQEAPSRSAVEQSNEDDRNAIDWLRSVGTGTALKIKLSRISPKVWDGHQIGGHLADFDEPFAEEEIRSRFGGGKFQIKVEKLTPKGNWQYGGARSLEIAGDPKLSREFHGSVDKDPAPVIFPPAREDDGMARKAMETLERIAQDSSERARELEDEFRKRDPFDKSMIELLLRPMENRLESSERELAEYRRLIAERDAKITELATRRPDTTLQDTLLGKMMDNESTRIEHIRTQFESERRQMQTSHQDEIRSNRDYFKQEMLMKEEAHKRELHTLRESQEARVEALKSGYEGRIDVFRGRVSDLERQLDEAKKEVLELRSKKDKSLVEQAEELAKTKNVFESLGMLSSGEEEEKTSTFERIATGIMESPFAQAMAARIANAPQAPAPQPNPAMRRAMRQQMQVQHPQSQQPNAQQAAPPPKKKKLPVFDPGEVAMATSFIENAIRSNVDPEEFARGAASVIPNALLEAIKSEGIDGFLARVVKPAPGTMLDTMQGKNFLRRALKMIEAGVEAPVPAPVPEVPVA